MSDDIVEVTNAPAETLPFPKHGVKLWYFQEIIRNVCGGEDNLQDLTTTDVCNKFIMPYTSATKSSLCDLLAVQHPEAVGKADVFISHAWKFKFLDVVNALENHFQHGYNPDIVLWFDLFSNNQHIGPTLTFDWWCGTFKTAISDLQHVVMVLAPWQDPIPLTRAWCLFELYCAAETKCTFEIALSATEEKNFLDTMVSDAETNVNAMLSCINCERSEAFKEEDRRMIFQVVEQTVGFTKINAMVFEQIRSWVVQTMESIFYKRLEQDMLLLAPSEALPAAFSTSELADESRVQPPAVPLSQSISTISKNATDRIQGLLLTSLNGHEDCLSADTYDQLVALAVLYRLQARFDLAEALYDAAYRWQSKHNGPHHQQTLIRLNNRAYIQQARGHLDQAVTLYEECMTLQSCHVGETHEDTLVTMNSLAAVYQSLGRLEEAQMLLESVVQSQTKVLGRDHLYTVVTRTNLAVVYDLIGRYDDAETIYLELLSLRETAFGPDHPDTLRILVNLATLYQNPRVQRYAEAETLFARVWSRRRIILGALHTATINAARSTASLYDRRGPSRRVLTEVIYWEALTGAMETYGLQARETLQIMYDLGVFYRYVRSDDKYLFSSSFEDSTPEQEEASLDWLFADTDVQDTPLSLQEYKQIARRIRSKNPDYLNRPPGSLVQSLLLDCVELQRQHLLPAQQRDLGMTCYVLGQIYENNLGLLDEAIAYYEECLPIRRAVYGPDSDYVHYVLHLIAFCLQKQGKNERAIAAHRECLQERLRCFGPVYSGVYSSVYFLALAIDALWTTQQEALQQRNSTGDVEDDPAVPSETAAQSEDEALATEVLLIEAETALTQFFEEQLRYLPSAENLTSPEIALLSREQQRQLWRAYADLARRFDSAQCWRLAQVLYTVLLTKTLCLRANGEARAEESAAEAQEDEEVVKVIEDMQVRVQEVASQRLVTDSSQ